MWGPRIRVKGQDFGEKEGNSEGQSRRVSSFLLPTQTPRRQTTPGPGPRASQTRTPGFLYSKRGTRGGHPGTLTRPGRAQGPACRSRDPPARKLFWAKPTGRGATLQGAAPAARPRPRRARTPTPAVAPRCPPPGCSAAPAACPRPSLCPRHCSRFP